MLKPKYDIGDKVALVGKDKNTVNIIAGIVDSIEITNKDIKYLVTYDNVKILYVSECNLCDNMDELLDRVVELTNSLLDK